MSTEERSSAAKLYVEFPDRKEFGEDDGENRLEDERAWFLPWRRARTEIERVFLAGENEACFLITLPNVFSIWEWSYHSEILENEGILVIIVMKRRRLTWRKKSAASHIILQR